MRVGVIGGGQLAAMMAIAAKSLNISVVVQTPDRSDPAVAIADNFVIGAIDQVTATEQLAAICDVITFENEFVDLDRLQILANRGVEFLPSLDSLKPLLDKYTQRLYLQAQGIPVPKFMAIATLSDVSAVSQSFAYPLVLKARRHGYDGQGTSIVNSEAELIEVWLKMGQVPALVEEKIDFVMELAIMIGRSPKGDCVIYPVVETQQRDQVCHRVISPAGIDPNFKEAVETQVQAIAKTIVTSLAAVGIFGIEYFLTADGKVSVNEIAPRTHNSGHLTIEACQTSQFEQLLRIVSGMPLGSVDQRSPVSIMINLLGYEHHGSDYISVRDRLSQLPQTFVHWYHKLESKPGRKLGHVTVLAENYEEATAIANQVEKIWYGNQ